MLSLLYPTMGLEEAIDALRSEGTSHSDIVAIAQLLGAYQGINREEREGTSEDTSEDTSEGTSEDTSEETSDESSD